MSTKHEPVMFLDAEGNPITNDPVVKAQQLLGITPEETTPPADEDLDTSDDDEYDALNGKQLKELAKSRDVDIAGLKKVSEVREALRAADAAGEGDDDTDTDDED